jgi:hypothetical protein
MKTVFIIFISVFLICINLCKAQSISFQINSIGNTPNMTVSSLSFQLDQIANCLFVGNGLSIYQTSISNAPFKLDCIVPIKFDRLGLKIFPNPIGNGPKIQFLQKNLSNTLFNIRFYNVEGKMVLEQSKTGFEMSSGVLLNTTSLFAGNYIVQVLSANSVDLIQVIKQD